MPKSRAKPLRTQFFSALLETMMERNGLNQVQLAASTGIAVSRINNYLQGKYRTIRPDHLAQIARAAGHTAAERGELAKAYVMDLLPEELHADLRLEVSAGAGKTTKAAHSERSLLPPAAASAIDRLIALSVRSSKARERVQLFAAVLQDAHPL